MFTSIRHTSKHCILALALAATLAAAVPALVPPAAAATPAVAVTTQVTTTYLPQSYQTVALRHVMLHITGSGFVPGSTVRFAAMTAARFELLAKGSTLAQPATVTWICGHDYKVCSGANPEAGKIDYHLRVGSLPLGAKLVMLYQAAGLTGLRDVAVASQ